MQMREREYIRTRTDWNTLDKGAQWREYAFVYEMLVKYRKMAGSPSKKGELDTVGRAQRNTGTKWAFYGNGFTALIMNFPWTLFLWVPLLGAKTVALLNSDGWMDLCGEFIQPLLATLLTGAWAHREKKNYESA